MIDLQSYSQEQLIQWLNDAARLWLAHDGLWFQAVEKERGMEEAIQCDTEAWYRFSPIEAERIMKRLKLPDSGGLKALATALKARLYTLLNEDEVELKEDRLVYTMKKCRVQEARRKKSLPDFPCKSVGEVEYRCFAETIDPAIRTRCLYCPPDRHPEDSYCSWEFTISDE